MIEGIKKVAGLIKLRPSRSGLTEGKGGRINRVRVLDKEFAGARYLRQASCGDCRYANVSVPGKDPC